MKHDITIRPATIADIPAIAGIYRPAVQLGTASFEYDPPDETEMARRMRTIQDAGYPYVVGVVEGSVAGYAYASSYRSRPGYRYSVENSVYVDTTRQRTGIGRRLLDEIIARCTAAGYRQMIAVIGDSGNAASIKLHRSAGFIFSGTIHAVGYKHGRWLDSVIMQRSLGEGDHSHPTA